MALKRILLGCHVYTSEGRDARIIGQLRDVCRAQPGVLLASTFVDEPYHRSSLTLVSRDADALASAVVNVAHAALAAIDMRTHDARHPRLGAVDHVSCHPVPADLDLAGVAARSSGGDDTPNSGGNDTRSSGGEAAARRPPPPPHGGERARSGEGAGSSGHDPAAALGAAAALARSIGRGLAGGAAAVPVYLYGAAHPAGRRLADIRRQLGYFGATDAERAAWAVAVAAGRDLSSFPPDMGPAVAHPARGVATVGAVPWIVNLNVPLDTGDVAAARRVARTVSERGGGLPGVEAMALAHAPGVTEVACNLLAPATSSPRVALAAVVEAAAREGLAVSPGGAYTIGRPPSEIAAAADAALPEQ